MMEDSDGKVPSICQTATRTWNVDEPPKICFKLILKSLLGQAFEVLIFVSIASPFFEVPVEGNIVKFVEAPHHQMQWIQAKSTNARFWNKIVENPFWFSHLYRCGTTHPALAIAYEIFVTPYDFGLSY